MSKPALLLACVGAAFGSAACAVTSAAAQDSQAVAPATPVAKSRSPYSLQAGLGLRSMHGDAWEGLDDQAAIDMTGIYAPENWPVGLEVGISIDMAQGEVGGNDRYSSTVEFSVGARKEFPVGERFTLLIGAGVFGAYSTDVDHNDVLDVTAFDGDSWGGVYAHGGFFVRVNEGVRVGFDVRMADGSDPEIAGTQRSGDYSQYALAVIFDF